MNNFLSEFSLNFTPYFNYLISILPKIIFAIFVFLCFYWIANRIKKFANKRLVQNMDDPLLATFLARVVKIGIVLIGFLVALQILGLANMAAGLITGASISAIVIGFAFKDIGENFLAGIMLAFNRPFKVGDIVELDGYKGVVIALNLRNAQIKTFDGKDIFIPNADVVKNPVVNYTMDGFLRYDFTIGLDYTSNLKAAKDLILKTMQQFPEIEQTNKSISVAVSNLATHAIELTAYYWLDTFDKNVSSTDVKNRAIEQVLAALKKADFYLPRNILELKNYNGEDSNTRV